MKDKSQITNWLKSDHKRWALLGHVRELDLPDCWIGAGFVRDMVWAKLHDQQTCICGDVDVIWFDAKKSSERLDKQIKAQLCRDAPAIEWSVKNQARMHIRNGDEPYTSSEDAMRHWPETATAIAVKRTAEDQCEVCAPYGLSDLFELKVRPTRDFAQTKRGQFDKRVAEKRWLQRFTKLQTVV